LQVEILTFGFAIHKSFCKIPILLLLTQLQIKNPHLDHAGFLFAKMRLKMFVHALFYALTKKCTPFVNADLPFQQTRRDKLAIQ